MERLKKNQNPLNFMKRFIMLILIFGLLFSSGFSIVTYTGSKNLQNLSDTNILNYNEIILSKIGTTKLSHNYNIMRLSSFPNYDKTGLYLQVSHIPNTLSSNNNTGKAHYTLEILKLEEQTTDYINFELDLNETYYFWLETSSINDKFEIDLVCNECNDNLFNSSTYSVGYNVLYNKPAQISSIFSPLLVGVNDLILINLSIWKILYYLLIASIIIGTIVGLVLISKKYYDWANRMDIWKRKNTRK